MGTVNRDSPNNDWFPGEGHFSNLLVMALYPVLNGKNVKVKSGGGVNEP